MNGLESVLLFSLVVTPFLGAAVLAFFPADNHKLIHWYTRIIAASGLAIAAYLFITFDTGDSLNKYIVDFD